MRMKAGFAALLACAVLTSCAPEAQLPRPAGTIDPTITESSPAPTAHPASSKACDLLTPEDREDLVRMSMNAEVPVRPVTGTEECVWTRSLKEPARSAIRVVAVNGQAWARVAGPQIIKAINHPSTDRVLDRKLEKALADVSDSSKELTDERVCEIYLLFTESRGMQRTDNLMLVGTIGSIPAVYAASCGKSGIIVLAGFGEYGLRSSLAINHAVVRLVEAASERADEVFEGSGNPEADGAEQGDTADEADAAADEDASPSPEPPTPADESESDDEDES